MLKADGFDEAIIGLCRIAGKEDVIAYDYWKCLDILINRDGMTPDDAVEFMEFNVIGAYVGEYTPAFIYEKEDLLYDDENSSSNDN